jgi:hypothetical protein
MRLAGKYGDGIEVQSRLDALDMSIVNAFYPGYGIGGKATGSLDFEQASPSAFPRADARLTIASFTRTTAAQVSQPVDVNFVGKLLPDGGEARAVFRERGAVIGRMVASLRPLGPAGTGTWTERLLSRRRWAAASATTARPIRCRRSRACVITACRDRSGWPPISRAGWPIRASTVSCGPTL